MKDHCQIWFGVYHYHNVKNAATAPIATTATTGTRKPLHSVLLRE
jgi:hypothetical protein